MTSRDQARLSKDKARETLNQLGFTVVSVGLTRDHDDWIIRAGVLQSPKRDIVDRLKVDDVRIRVFQESHPTLHRNTAAN